MHRTNSLRQILRSIPGKIFKGKLYRTVQADALYGFSKAGPYMPRPLYNLGPSNGGARYTTKGGEPSIYFAEDVETAMRELLRIPVPQSLKPSNNFSTLVTYEAEVALESILDLTQYPIRHLFGTTLKELAEPWRFRKDGLKPATQRLGAVVATSGKFQGIRFHSTMKSGECIVIFTDEIAPSSFIEVMDPKGKLIGRLP